MQAEPLVSVPLGFAVLGVLLVSVILGLSIYLIVRRRQRQESISAVGVWSIMLRMPFPALFVSGTAQIQACNDAAKHQLDVVEGERLPRAFAEVVRRVAESANPEIVSLSLKGRDGMLPVHATPIHRANEPGSILLQLPELSARGDPQVQVRKLLSGLTHELRTPLTAITGHLDILKSSGPDEVDLRDRSYRFISAEVSRLTRLVDELLQLSRLEDAPLDLRPVNPRSLAEEAISGLYDNAAQKHISLVMQAAPDLPRVRGDRDRLKQVLINLLDNAIKFTPEGGNTEIALSQVSSGVEFSVSDSGPGISATDQPHVFEPYFRGTHPEFRAVRGAGLGLTIVKSILDQHGCQISLESKPESGTRFSFILHPA